MLTIVVALALAADGGEAAKALADKCRDPRMHRVEQRGSGEPQKLNREPKGKGYYTVERRLDGCSRPVMVRDMRAGR